MVWCLIASWRFGISTACPQMVLELPMRGALVEADLGKWPAVQAEATVRHREHVVVGHRRGPGLQSREAEMAGAERKRGRDNDQGRRSAQPCRYHLVSAGGSIYSCARFLCRSRYGSKGR